MAEAALFGIAKSVLQQLASPALDEFRLLWGHKEQFEKLEDTVTTIRDVLEDADRKQATDAAVQGWLARLRVVLYEADDLFDAISAKLLLEKNKKGTKIGKKVLHFLLKQYRFASLVKNAHKVKEIRERFDDIARDIKGFNFLPSQPDLDATSRFRRDQTHSFVPKSVVVGREQETEDVVRMLLSDCSEGQRGVSIIAVIGIGGLGKTTLAKLVYNDERVQQGFDLCMWACINYFSDLKQVLITLLKSATMREPENLDLDQLQSLFRKEIEGKRFLLVLDDVWDEDSQKWRNLKDLLSSGKEGSKVLTTTRSKLIAQRSCATKPYFYLQGLSDESAWLLFKKIAFEDEEYQNNSELEQLGRLIARKCANVPLAIVTIASLLREKEKERWPLVNDELSKAFPDDYDEKIMHTLEISYKELPYPVKRCFGYCSLFPKDYKFDKGSLIHLWIAQGFVEPLLNRRLEDIAEEYFFCLLDRCFFQLPTGDKETKRIVTYQMHDLMHDLAKKATKSESILVDNTDQRSWDKTIRHVSINCRRKSMVDHVCSFSHSKNLRTFLNPRRDFFNPNALEKLMPSFKSLRVLSFSGIRDLPTSIGELIHLRFLDLSENYMYRLPSSICSLPHLQFLILRSCNSEDLEFPKEMGDMLSLGHLDLSKNKAITLPRSICSLRHLQSLILREWKALKELPEDLGDLLSLRLLDLSKSYNLERLPRSICRLRHLESLILRECKHLKELPEELGDLLSLRHLVLQGCGSLVKMPPGLAALTSLVTLDKLVVHNPSGGLKYLEGLDNLTGSLEIVLPSTEWVSATTDAEKSSLSKKTRLHSLAIICKIRQEDPLQFEPAKANTEVNALQLPPNLVDLSIIYFGGKEILNEVSRLHKLVILKLKGCRRCVKLPPLSYLPTLKELRISNMASMLTIEESKSYEPNSFFPSLETLSIKNMWNLTGWWLQAPTVLPTFPRLTRVSICNCRQLTRCIPLFPVVEHLELKFVREEIIWQIIGSEATSTSTSHGNSVLQKLEISSIGDLSSIAEAQIRHLSDLQHLSIEGCDKLESIALNGLAYLTSLEHLRINKWFGQEINWGGQEEEVRRIHLPRVRHLKISTVNWNLFEVLKDMASLERLTVEKNFNEELQEEHEEEEGLPWKHLQKLRYVELVFGEGFSMRNNQRLLHGFTSLKYLDLRKCKELYLSWRALLGLPHLEWVVINDVEEVIDVYSDAMMIQTQPISRSIRYLTIINSSGEWVHDIPWKSLPFLEHLLLDRMRNLKSLPEGIQHLSALKSLRIYNTPGVVSLPHWMSSLSSLGSFCAWSCCEELKSRCNGLTGEDWPKIQHIPIIDIH